MKKLLIVVLALASLVQANAQVAPGMKYKEIKGMYDAKMYVPQSIDPYNKTVASLVSFFVPGAAQLCMGELGRGIAFVAGEAVLAGIMRSAAQTFSESVITDANGNVTGYNDEAKAKSSSTLLLCSVAGYIGVCIWSSCQNINRRSGGRSRSLHLVQLRCRKGRKGKEHVLSGPVWPQGVAGREFRALLRSDSFGGYRKRKHVQAYGGNVAQDELLVLPAYTAQFVSIGGDDHLDLPVGRR